MSVEKAIVSLDDLSTNVSKGLADFNDTAKELTRIVGDLPREFAVEVVPAFEQAATRAIQSAGIEVRCSVDFARMRLAADIAYLASALKAKLCGRPAPPAPTRPPVLCQASPLAIDPERIGERDTTVTWDGWDLMSQDGSGNSIRCALLRLKFLYEGPLFGRAVNAGAAREPRRDGPPRVAYATEYRDVLSINSNYRVTADLTRLGPLDPHDYKLALLWNDRVLSEVPIHRPDRPERSIESRVLSPLLRYVAPASGPTAEGRADGEFGDGGPLMRFKVCLEIREASRIVALVHFEALEWRADRSYGDGTQAAGDFEQVVYIAPDGERLLDIRSETCDQGEWFGREGSYFGAIYREYKLIGNRPGTDVGANTSIAAPGEGHVVLEVER